MLEINKREKITKGEYILHQTSFRKMIILAILIALSSMLSYFDGYICSFISFGLIRYKLGLANIVIMVILYNYNFRSTILAVVIKSLIVGLLFGPTGIVTFIISLFGSILSAIGMYIFKKILTKARFTPFIGVIGGFLHPIGQIIGAISIYGFKEFFKASLITAPVMLMLGIITGFIVGLSAQRINKYLEKKIN